MTETTTAERKPLLLKLAERLEQSDGNIDHKAIGQLLTRALGLKEGSEPTASMKAAGEAVKAFDEHGRAEFHDTPHGWGQVFLRGMAVGSSAATGRLAVVAALCRAVHAAQAGAS